jgi:hypothetical protein
MIVVIQGLVILFAGGLEMMFAPALLRLFAVWSRPARGVEPAAVAVGEPRRS